MRMAEKQRTGKAEETKRSPRVGAESAVAPGTPEPGPGGGWQSDSPALLPLRLMGGRWVPAFRGWGLNWFLPEGWETAKSRLPRDLDQECREALDCDGLILLAEVLAYHAQRRQPAGGLTGWCFRKVQDAALAVGLDPAGPGAEAAAEVAAAAWVCGRLLPPQLGDREQAQAPMVSALPEEWCRIASQVTAAGRCEAGPPFPKGAVAADVCHFLGVIRRYLVAASRESSAVKLAMVAGLCALHAPRGTEAIAWGERQLQWLTNDARIPCGSREAQVVDAFIGRLHDLPPRLCGESVSWMALN